MKSKLHIICLFFAANIIAYGLNNNLSKLNTKNADLVFANSAVADNLMKDTSVRSKQESGPKINVSGKGMLIANGDTTTNANNNTYFGEVYSSSGSTYGFFQINNSGDSDLILDNGSGFKIVGESANDFEFMNLAYLNNVIKPGESGTFRIDFNPNGSGIRTAMVTVENNDTVENPFTFTIMGKGLEPFEDPLGIFADINTEILGVGSDGSYIGRSSTDWGDYDNDGDLDFIITGFSNTGFAARIYRNEGNNNFVGINAVIKSVGRGYAKWGDYDNDNDLDLIVTGLGSGTGGGIAIIYRNDENDTFSEVITLEGITHSSSSWGDYDNDGDLDIILNGINKSNVADTKLYRNDGNDTFTIISTNLSPVYWGESSWGDFDNDGDLDIVIAGDKRYGYNDPITKIYRNDGDAKFIDINANIPGYSYSSVEWGDYDSDGDLDLIVAGSNGSAELNKPYTKIFRNDGNNIFTDIETALVNVKDGAVRLGDYNNDGALDLIITGYSDIYSYQTIVYENLGSDTFTKIVDLIGVSSSSASWGDYDLDGNLDLITSGNNYNQWNAYGNSSYQITKIYQNNSNSKNTAPIYPSNLVSEVNDNTVTLSWNKATDYETQQNSLTYNIYIGTLPGKSDKVSPVADIQSGKRRIAKMGNTGLNTSWTITKLEYGKTYYWSVQAIDNSFSGSEFAEEQKFYVNSPPTTTGIGDLIVDEDSKNQIIDLTKSFDDLEDTPDGLIYSIENVSNPTLFDSVHLNRSELLIDLKENATGNSTFLIRAKDSFDSYVNTSFNVIVRQVNDLPIFENLPDSMSIVDDEIIYINLWELVNDIETPDNLITFDFNSTNDSLLVSYDEYTGILSLSCENDFSGVVKLEIIAKDNFGGNVSQTVIIKIEKTIVGTTTNYNEIPDSYYLSQNYPNPFNPFTVIDYQIKEAGYVEIKVYDILGNLVEELVNINMSPGFYKIEFDGSDLSSGLYFYAIGINDFFEVKKMLLLK